MVFDGPLEVDETYIGGLEKNKHAKKKLKAGRGPVGKTAVVGMKDRATKQVAAKVIDSTDKETLQGFVHAHARQGAKVYTDDTSAYKSLDNHENVKHSIGEFVRGMAHTNGVESFWAMLKRAHKGVYHRLSAKHLQAYVNMFAGPPERARDGHARADAARGRRHGRAVAHVSRPDRGPRALGCRGLDSSPTQEKRRTECQERTEASRIVMELWHPLPARGALPCTESASCRRVQVARCTAVRLRGIVERGSSSFLESTYA